MPAFIGCAETRRRRPLLEEALSDMRGELSNSSEDNNPQHTIDCRCETDNSSAFTSGDSRPVTVSAEVQTRTRHMWSLSHALCAARWALSRSRYVESLFRVSSGRWVRGTQEMCGKPLRPGQLVHSIGDQRTWSRASRLNLAWLTYKNEVHDTGKVILFPAVILRRSYSAY